MSSTGLPPFHEVWASIRRMIGEPVTMLGQHKRFFVKDQSTESLAVAPVDSKDAPKRIPREEFERAWQQLKSAGRLPQQDLADKIGTRHAAFIASVLAQTPGIGYRADPIELYLDSQGDGSRASALQKESATPSQPRESTRPPRTRDSGRGPRERSTTRPHRVDRAMATAVERWLTASGWRCQTRPTQTHSWTIEARDGAGRRWVISVEEPRAAGDSEFLEALGAVLRRMDDPAASYSLTLPDRAPYRAGWTSLPALVKRRLALTAFFVTDRGEVTYLDV